LISVTLSPSASSAPLESLTLMSIIVPLAGDTPRPHGEERIFARLEPSGNHLIILRDARECALLRMRPDA
jgi:hypothetical protein